MKSKNDYEQNGGWCIGSRGGSITMGGAAERSVLNLAIRRVDLAEPLTEEDPESHSTGLPIWKRALDLIFLLITSPAWLMVGLLVALIVRLGSRGPIFFTQKRVGFKGREFLLYKFRTMQTGAGQDMHRQYTADLIKTGRPMVKLDEGRDPRLIAFGSLLRAGGLDELPQIINIFRGEMSIVGPRPCIPYEYELHQPEQKKRYNAVPGLTGAWQVNGKNRTTFERMVELDIRYAQNLSLQEDLKIILMTLPALWRQFSDLRSSRSRQAASPVNAGKLINSASNPL